MERTLVLFKPDSVQRGLVGRILERFEAKGLKIIGLKLRRFPGTELIANRDTDGEIADFVEAFARVRLGREIIRTADTPAFAGNRVGFKVLNECAQLAGRGPRPPGLR